MNKQCIAKITDEETDDYSWMQRSEPQWKRLNYKELFQQIPFAVLSFDSLKHSCQGTEIVSDKIPFKE